MADDFFDDCRARSRSRARARRCTVADIAARRAPQKSRPAADGFFHSCKEVETVKWGGSSGSNCHFNIVHVGRDLGFVENAPSVSFRDGRLSLAAHL
jgi:hypothetical protein